MLKDFKDFALKGNVLDLAIGVIIGASFGKIVSSLVSDIIMPPIGLILGRVDFSNLYLNLSQNTYTSLIEAKKAGAPTLNYGLFINNLIEFFILAASVYLLVRAITAFKKESAPIPTAHTECAYCLSQIPLAAKKCAHCTSPLIPE